MSSPSPKKDPITPIAFFGLVFIVGGGYILWLVARLFITPPKRPLAAWAIICAIAVGLLLIAGGVLVLWRSGKPLSNHPPYSDAGRCAELRLRELLWGANMFITFFVILLILGVTALTYEMRFVHLSTATRGDVVKVVPNDKTDTVTYSFADVQGIKHRDSDICSKGQYKPGDKIDLLYVIGRSGAHSQVVGLWNQWFWSVICFAGAGIVFWVSRRLRSSFRKAIRRLDEIERGSVPSAQARA